MDISIAIAGISAAVSISAAALSAHAVRSTAVLQDSFTRRRERESREQRLDEVVSMYREPLLLAAFDLQSRLFNIARRNFLVYLHQGAEEDRRYALDNTLFLFAQFFGWVEALRVDVQFLDTGDLDTSRRLRAHLDHVRRLLASDAAPDGPLRFFWGVQRAIGELMLAKGPDGSDAMPRRCVGYAAFVDRLEGEPGFGRWFARPGADLESMAIGDEPPERLLRVQAALVDLIGFLDPKQYRFPPGHLTKAAEAVQA